MNKLKVLASCFLVTAIATALPVPRPNNKDLLEPFKLDDVSSSEESVHLQRRIFEENSDGRLKKISLRSLIGYPESGPFASALHKQKENNDEEANILETKSYEHAQHNITKGNTKVDPTTTTTTTTESNALLPTTEKLIIQTTEKMPEFNSASANQTCKVSLIPIFDIKHDTSDDSKDHKITTIKTESTHVADTTTTTSEESGYSSTFTTNSALLTSVSTSTTTTATKTVENSTTPKSIEEQLKEAEEELKEKVAEIEAEPIILSARV